MERHFDLIYDMLCMLIGFVLAYATITGLKAFRTLPAGRTRRQASGIAEAAVGVAVALAGGLFADAMLKQSIYFQQVRFALYYLGFGLITLGTTKIVDAYRTTGVQSSSFSRSTIPVWIVWACFTGPLVLAVVYLVDSRTFILNSAEMQVQRTIYWIPMLGATGSAAVVLVSETLRRKNRCDTKVLCWTAAFAALIFFGLLCESLILPDFGDPLSNLLVAFVPFALGSFCLDLGARRTLEPMSPVRL